MCIARHHSKAASRAAKAQQDGSNGIHGNLEAWRGTLPAVYCSDPLFLSPVAGLPYPFVSDARRMACDYSSSSSQVSHNIKLCKVESCARLIFMGMWMLLGMFFFASSIIPQQQLLQACSATSNPVPILLEDVERPQYISAQQGSVQLPQIVCS
jgi:hypothetical protein